MSGASASRPTGSGIDTLIVGGPTAENRRVDRSSRRHGKGASVPRRPDAELDLDIAGIEELTQDRIDALVEGFLGAEGEFGPIARARRWQVCEGSHLGGQADHGQQLAIQGRVRLGVEAQLKDDRVGCGRGGAEAGAVGDAADEALWPDGRAAGAQQERRAPPAPAANSSRRFVTALATATASSGKSSARYMAGSATQTTTPAGNSRAMSVACKLHAARLVTRLRQWTVASRIMKFTRVGETPRLAAMSFWLTPRKRCSSNA